jgi:hypothetical protein
MELEKVVATGAEKSFQNKDTPSEEEIEYPRGFTFMLLTVDLMAIIPMLASDNYIIGSYVRSLPNMG